MAHPFNDKRQGKVERARVSERTKGYKSGGSVFSSAKDDKTLKNAARETAMKLHGGSVSRNQSRPGRARGGMIEAPGLKTGKGSKLSKGTKVINNIIIAGAGKSAKPEAEVPPVMPPMPMPPKPPMAAPPGLPGPAGLPPLGGPPGMPPPPMRASGGKVEKEEKKAVPLPPRDPRKLAPDEKGRINVGSGVGYKKGGGAKWEGSKRDVAEDKRLAKKHGMSMKDWEKSAMDKAHDRKRSSGGKVDASQGATPVQSSNTKETELKNTGRGKVITY